MYRLQMLYVVFLMYLHTSIVSDKVYSHISEVFQLSKEHITPDRNAIPGAPRPHNAQLSNAKLEKLAIGKHTPFREGIKAALQPWVQSPQS